MNSDYDDSEESTNDYCSDSSETVSYHQPIFLRKRKQEGGDRPVKVEVINTPTIDSQSSKKNIQKKETIRFVNVNEDKSSGDEMRSNAKEVKEETTKTNSHKRKKFYEYGESISGYKFISLEPPNIKPTDDLDPSGENNNTDSKFDSSQFDRYKKRRTSSSEVLNTDVFKIYWESNGVEWAPIISKDGKDLNSLKNININSITNESVQDFYAMSCVKMKFKEERMLKQERVRWHPDKLRTTSDLQKAKVTRLFQIINELWESLRTK